MIALSLFLLQVLTTAREIIAVIKYPSYRFLSLSARKDPIGLWSDFCGRTVETMGRQDVVSAILVLASVAIIVLVSFIERE